MPYERVVGAKWFGTRDYCAIVTSFARACVAWMETDQELGSSSSSRSSADSFF